MKISNSLILAFLLPAATALSAAAQTNGSNSPYSRYCYGLLSDRAGGFNKAMGGVAYGFQKGNELNSKNPASYASLDSLTFLFDAGIALQNGNFDAGNQRINAQNTSFDYIQAGFRLHKNVGLVVGMLPFSAVGYNVSQTEEEQRISDMGYDTQTQTYKGDGGVHEVFLGLGWQPLKGFSIGLNAGYLWGSLTHLAYDQRSTTSINTKRTEYNAHIRSYKLDFGAQYTLPASKSGIWTIGATYGMGHKIDNSAIRNRSELNSGYIETTNSAVVRNAFELPHTFGVGTVWNNYDKWRVGIDYTFEKWGSVRFPYTASDAVASYGSTAGHMLDRHSIAAGVEFIPKPDGMRWGDRVRYRAGISYSTPYTKIETDNKWIDGPRSICASIGAGLPIATRYDRARHHSVINIALQYEHVKPGASHMLTESYIRFCLGFTFNERWFLKWKVE